MQKHAYKYNQTVETLCGDKPCNDHLALNDYIS